MPSRAEQVKALVAEGKSNREIAAILGIKLSTVRYHREPSKRQQSLQEMVQYLHQRE